MSAGRRRGRAFDPTRLDDLDDVLAPPQQGAEETRDDEASHSSSSNPDSDEQTVQGSRHEAPTPTAPAKRSAPRATLSPADSVASQSTSRARSSADPARSGPSRQPRAPGGRIATAVRLPAEVYHAVNDHLLSGTERPSYGQLVMWSVEDHRRDVIATVEAALPDPADRSPRGRRLAQDRVPVGLQLLSSERAELDELAEEIASRDVAASRSTRVTRTDVATAALRVAVQERTGQLR